MGNVNWQQIVLDLQAAGFSQYKIAELIGTKQPYISQMATGKREPKGWELCNSLLRLHERQCRPAA